MVQRHSSNLSPWLPNPRSWCHSHLHHSLYYVCFFVSAHFCRFGFLRCAYPPIHSQSRQINVIYWVYIFTKRPRWGWLLWLSYCVVFCRGVFSFGCISFTLYRRHECGFVYGVSDSVHTHIDKCIITYIRSMLNQNGQTNKTKHEHTRIFQCGEIATHSRRMNHIQVTMYK